ncbi:hypothetical protein CEXT_799961 [Caerostris extrusa]|uniref:Uncharacterized protein n=1 Tax=Caerostris extrusa TaxID=172846 RepID=A0AAV4U988_CAEEX|nr:hypothetical protein CEXT_799961 [Caerostris extrusa]
MGTDRGLEFCEIMNEIYYMTLRNNIAQYTTRARTNINAVFSTDSQERVACMIVFSVVTCLYTFKSMGKKRRSSFVWADPGILPLELTGKVMMMDINAIKVQSTIGLRISMFTHVLQKSDIVFGGQTSKHRSEGHPPVAEDGPDERVPALEQAPLALLAQLSGWGPPLVKLSKLTLFFSLYVYL